MAIHIGEEILKYSRKNRIGATELAKMIGKSRQNVNDIFTRSSIDSDLLHTISIALDYNFFELYSEQFAFAKGIEYAAFNRGDIVGDLERCREEKRNLEEKYSLQTENAINQQKYIKILEEKLALVKKEG